MAGRVLVELKLHRNFLSPMKTLLSSLFLCCLGFAQVPSPLSPAAPPKPATPVAAPVAPDAIVAEINGKKYTAAEADGVLALLPPQMQTAIRKEPTRALGYVIMMKYLAAEAEKQKLDQQSPLKEQLEYNRMGALMQAEINQVRNFDVKVEPTDEEKFYKDNPERWKQAKVKVIYIAFTSAQLATKPDAAGHKMLSEPEAKLKIEDLKKQIAAGADFGKLARENSDDKASAEKDGDFGIIKHSSPYPDGIKNAVFSLKAGDVSEPIRQPNGFYLIKLEGISTQPLSQVRSDIFNELKQKGFNDWMQSVQKRFDVKIENPGYFTNKSGGTPPAQPR